MKPIEISPKPSRLLQVMLAGVHLLALLVLALLLWYGVFAGRVAMVLLLLVCANGVFYLLHRECYTASALRVGVNGVLAVHHKAQWLEAEVSPSSVVTPFLIVLRLRVVETRQVIYELILRDAVNAEEFRRLRVWLKWR